MDKESKLYEIAYIISPALSEEEAKDFHQHIKNQAQELGGLIDHEGEVKKRHLSYPIKKMTDGYLASFRFILSRGKAETLKQFLAEKRILRFVLIETRRNPVRTMPPRITKTAPITTPLHTEIPVTQPITQEKIEEIDKKLEEILGT